MAISGKVKASTVAASVTTVITGILAPHVFRHSVPSDVRGLIEGGVTGAVTFGFGWLAKHGIDGEQLVEDVFDVAEDLGVPYMSVPDVVDEPVSVVAAGAGSVAAGGDIGAVSTSGEARPLV
jgi:hypothetical protein